tara:strand:+ start:824 stop:1732 length:909 start_codon:yes stop_codon:yes gene_type:complete
MYLIKGFYKIKNINNLLIYKEKIKKYFLSQNVKGTVIISPEGINGTIAGKKIKVTKCLNFIKKIFLIDFFDSENSSYSRFLPFYRAKIKIKKEVVPIGLKLKKEEKRKSLYVEPKNWNKLVKDKNITLIDMRKPFEFKVGTFRGSTNPKINSFRDFPKYFNKLKNKKSKFAMFCTGGIRCEKAANYMNKKGFKNVFQLKGGILNYLNKINIKKSIWQGECFVFDNRVSVKHKLVQGSYSMCRGCRMPISKADKKSNKYKEGISCPHCYSSLTKLQKNRFSMRQKQILIAKKLNKPHIFQKEY